MVMKMYYIEDDFMVEGSFLILEELKRLYDLKQGSIFLNSHMPLTHYQHLLRKWNIALGGPASKIFWVDMLVQPFSYDRTLEEPEKTLLSTTFPPGERLYHFTLSSLLSLIKKVLPTLLRVSMESSILFEDFSSIFYMF